ncbi:DedA/Tvp38 family (DedA) [Fructobacillus cardui]|uniref:DedA family protein n=1 Tax=Fructobacillus cardui TaxID=2893170 RepID=UPI002D8C334E|nr:DedA/Tvp38 family (DedA) [Fructobacillus cardui]
MVLAFAAVSDWLTHISSANANFSVIELSILFFLILIETGGIVTGFIPADALVMTAAGFAGRHHSLVEFALLVVIFAVASMMGDSINYWFGAWVIKQIDKIPWVARHVNGDFAEKISANLNPKRWLLFIILGRVVPFVRTIVPLSAHRLKLRFATYFRMSVLASCLWAITMVTIGYYFGHLQLPREVTITVIVLAAIFVLAVIRSLRFRQIIIKLITKPSREKEEEL